MEYTGLSTKEQDPALVSKARKIWFEIYPEMIEYLSEITETD